MILNMKPDSTGKDSVPAVKSRLHQPCAHRVAILNDSTIGMYTFRLRYKYNATGPNRVCIARALGRTKKCAENSIKATLSLTAKVGSDLALLRFEPMSRSEVEALLKQQEHQDDQVYGLSEAA